MFDHFVFRNNLTATAFWNTASYWTEGGTANLATLKPADAYANAIIEFAVRDDADYTATNDMRRMSNRTFMLNDLRLTGDFNGVQGRSATLNGNPVLFLKSLSGVAPQIRLDALSTGTAANFTFNLDLEIQLLDDLEITGNGTENFVINGQIRDHYELLTNVPTVPKGIVKKGTSRVTLTGNNIFGGTLTIEGGRVTLDGASAAINGAAGIVVGSGGEFVLTSGTVAVQTIDNSAIGGVFHFNGGTPQSGQRAWRSHQQRRRVRSGEFAGREQDHRRLRSEFGQHSDGNRRNRSRYSVRHAACWRPGEFSRRAQCATHQWVHSHRRAGLPDSRHRPRD